MSIRPGKYTEYDFSLHEVNRLAVKEANAKKPIYTMHKWLAAGDFGLDGKVRQTIKPFTHGGVSLMECVVPWVTTG